LVAPEKEKLDHALKVCTGDEKAKREHGKLDAEAFELAGELERLGDAVEEANRHLHAAEQAIAAEQDRANAHIEREIAGCMGKRAGFLDDALQIVVEELNGLLGDIHELHARGVNFPFGQQLETWAHRVLLSALGQSPLRRRFDLLSQADRTTFKAVAADWHAGIERAAAARLGEGEKKEKEAAA